VVQNCVGNCIRGGASNAIENCLCAPERRRGGRGSVRGALVVNASRNQKYKERDKSMIEDGQGVPLVFSDHLRSARVASRAERGGAGATAEQHLP
jgi:hypothetical protein